MQISVFTIMTGDRKKRLAILAPLKEWGGIERKMLILCREFVAAGIDVEFLLTRGGRVPYPSQFPSEVRIVDLGSRGKLDALPKLIRHLRQSRPDALLTAKDHAAKVGVLASRLGRLSVPVYVKVTNTLSQTLRRPAKRYSARWLYRRAARVIAISNGVREDLIQEFGMRPDLVEVIYNPMFTPDFPERAAQPVDHPWLQAGQPPVFMGAGRLTTQKDFVTLVDAFADLRSRRECRLIILGEGTEREAILRRAADLGVSDDVDLPGYIQDPIPWMARAGVFVLSSRYEGLGNVLVEAMAVGTQVVSTDCPSGPREILEGGRFGKLVPVGDARALAQGMAGALDQPMAKPDLIAGAERFRSATIAGQYLSLMRLID